MADKRYLQTASTEEQHKEDATYINIDDLLEETMDQLDGVTHLSVNGFLMSCCTESFRILFDHLFKEGNAILKIACGVANLKGQTSITETDMIQALAIKQNGAERYLPKQDD